MGTSTAPSSWPTAAATRPLLFTPAYHVGVDLAQSLASSTARADGVDLVVQEPLADASELVDVLLDRYLGCPASPAWSRPS